MAGIEGWESQGSSAQEADLQHDILDPNNFLFLSKESQDFFNKKSEVYTKNSKNKHKSNKKPPRTRAGGQRKMKNGIDASPAGCRKKMNRSANHTSGGQRQQVSKQFSKAVGEQAAIQKLVSLQKQVIQYHKQQSTSGLDPPQKLEVQTSGPHKHRQASLVKTQHEKYRQKKALYRNGSLPKPGTIHKSRSNSPQKVIPQGLLIKNPIPRKYMANGDLEVNQTPKVIKTNHMLKIPTSISQATPHRHGCQSMKMIKAKPIDSQLGQLQAGLLHQAQVEYLRRIKQKRNPKDNLTSASPYPTQMGSSYQTLMCWSPESRPCYRGDNEVISHKKSMAKITHKSKLGSMDIKQRKQQRRLLELSSAAGNQASFNQERDRAKYTITPKVEHSQIQKFMELQSIQAAFDPQNSMLEVKLDNPSPIGDRQTVPSQLQQALNTDKPRPRRNLKIFKTVLQERDTPSRSPQQPQKWNMDNFLGPCSNKTQIQKGFIQNPSFKVSSSHKDFTKHAPKVNNSDFQFHKLKYEPYQSLQSQACKKRNLIKCVGQQTNPKLLPGCGEQKVFEKQLQISGMKQTKPVKNKSRAQQQLQEAKEFQKALRNIFEVQK